jgi:hypothetical protein
MFTDCLWWHFSAQLVMNFRPGIMSSLSCVLHTRVPGVVGWRCSEQKSFPFFCLLAVPGSFSFMCEGLEEGWWSLNCDCHCREASSICEKMYIKDVLKKHRGHYTGIHTGSQHILTVSGCPGTYVVNRMWHLCLPGLQPIVLGWGWELGDWVWEVLVPGKDMISGFIFTFKQT